MISKTLKTLAGPVKIKIPENLNEITIGQAIEAENWTEESESVPYITGLTKNVTDNIIDYNQLIDIRDRTLSLAHKIKYCYNETAIPDYVTFGSKIVRKWWGVTKQVPNRVPVLRNLGIEPAGALLASRELIADERMRHIKLFGDDWEQNFTPSFDCCCGILANYFYCPVTGELYSTHKAEAFKSEIMKLPIQTALPIARFFFQKYPNLQKRKISLWGLFLMQLRLRRELITSKRSGI